MSGNKMEDFDYIVNIFDEDEEVTLIHGESIRIVPINKGYIA